MTEEIPTTSVTVRIDADRSKHIAHLVLVWSNFEIGDLDFWRGEAYSKYFEYLESKGGFYYEVCILFLMSDAARSPAASAGEMLLYTASPHHFFSRRIRYISSKKSGTAMSPSNTAHKELPIRLVNAGAKRRITLTMKGPCLFFYRSRVWFLRFRSYSCTFRYDRLFNS
jgi:hypothetical protein